MLARSNLANVVQELGDLEQARALHEENLRDAEEQGNARIAAVSLDQLAQAMSAEGRREEALSMLQRSLRMRRELGDRPMLAENLGRLAHVIAQMGDAAEAARLLSSSEALREQIGSNSTPAFARKNEETLIAIRSRLGDDAFAEAWDEGRALTNDEAVELALGSAAPPAGSTIDIDDARRRS